MPDESPFVLHNCRQLFEKYPSSTSLRPAVEVIERTIRDEPGLAFTHCRGLLETVCITILADRGIDVPENSKPNWLMSKAAQTLELTALEQEDKQAEEGVRDVLRGLNSLISGVANVRNSRGVGPHGRDALERVLSSEYATLIARSVDAAVGLMFRLHQEQLGRDPVNHLRFAVHTDFDAHLDSEYPDIVIEEAPIRASRALYDQDRVAYRKSLVEFRSRGENTDEPGQIEDDIAEGESISEGSDG